MATLEEDKVYNCSSNPIGLVIYNPHGRDGAEVEADDLEDGLNEAGFSVIRGKWTTKVQLCALIDSVMKSISGCTLLFVCIMSHGSAGKLKTAEGDCVMIINDILYGFNIKLKKDKLGQIPLVSIARRCLNYHNSSVCICTQLQ